MNAGAALSFAVTFTNAGPNTAAGYTQTLKIVDNAGNGLGAASNVTFSNLPTGVTAAYNTGTGVVTFTGIPAPATLASGANLNLTVTVGNVPGGITSIVASSTVGTTTSQGSDAGANTASSTVTVTPVADVSAVLSGPTTAPAGSFAAYIITVKNNSTTTAATDVVAVVQLPAGSTEVSASNQGTYNSTTNQVTFPTLTSLGANKTPVYRVQLRVPANGSITATASSTSSTADPVPANNNGTATAASVTTTITQVADISITANGPAQAVAGAQLTYNVLVTNYGPSVATNVTAKLTFSGSTPASATVGGGGSYSGGVVTFTVPGSTLASGASAAYTVGFTAPASGAVTGTVANISATTSTDPIAANNDGSTSDAIVTTTILTTLPSTECVPFPATLVNYTFTGTSPSLNTYYPGTANAAAGQTVVTVGTLVPATATALAAGDLVAIVQMQGADIAHVNDDTYGSGFAGAPGNGQLSTNLTAGQYEYAVVASVTATSVTLTKNLVNSYQNADATTTAGQKRFQLIRVPQYQSITLAADVANVPAWNGTTGGMLVLDVAGQLDLASHKIDLKGKGFRGGAGRTLVGATSGAGTDYVTLASAGANASKGEGIAGTPRFVNNNGVLLDNTAEGYPSGSYGRGAPGNAGGGGTDSDPSANDENTGGGGGSNAGTGGTGGNGWNSNQPYGGDGGAPFLRAAPSRLIMGGGGGAGTTNNGTGATGDPTGGLASSGAAGGGLALIRATTVSAAAGTIDVSGADMTFVPANDGSGGGGAGGSVLLIANNSLANIIILAKGGGGGSNTGGATNAAPHGPGGGGSGGVAFSSSATSATSSFTPGVNGTTTGTIAYGSTPGTTLTPPMRANVTAGETPLLQAAANCVADVTTTISGPTSIPTGAPSGLFTATFTNNGLGPATFMVRTVTLPVGATLSPTQQGALPSGATYAAPANATSAGSIDFGNLTNVASGTTSTVTFRITAPIVPTNTVLSIASATNTPSQGTNQGSDVGPNTATQNVTITTSTTLAGTIFADENYGGGSGRDYGTANTSATASGLANAIGSVGTTVELYDNTGGFVASTVTTAGGVYSFTVGAGTYSVRVVSATVKSARNTGNATGLVPVQTFRTDNGAADANRVGGENPIMIDALANAGAQSLSALTAGGRTAESIGSVTIATAPVAVTGVDFGFNFNMVVNTNDAGAGSLRQFILNSNALDNTKLSQAAFNGTVAPGTTAVAPTPGVETAIFMMNDGRTAGTAPAGLRLGLTAPTGYNATTGFTVTLASALPAITDAKSAINGNFQAEVTGDKVAANATLGSAVTTGAEVTINFNAFAGLLVTGGTTQIRSLEFDNAKGTSVNATGTVLTDGAAIAVSGAAATGTIIQDVTTTGNTTAGVYLTNGATGVSVLNSVLRSGAGTAAGTGVAATDGAGLVLNGASTNTITGNTAYGNAGYGVVLLGTASNGNTISNNTINANGTGTATTNDAGLSIQVGNNNLISLNTITGNSGDGVVALAGTSGNRLTRNNTGGNEGSTATGNLGIDLSAGNNDNGDGVTLNADGKTASSGANGLLNFPVFTQATVYNGNLLVTGYAKAGAVLEFYVASADPTKFGEGALYLSSATEGSTDDTDALFANYSGVVGNMGLNQGSETGVSRFRFSIPVTAAQITSLVSSKLTATATVPVTVNGLAVGNTSEFAGIITVLNNQPLPVELVEFTATPISNRDSRLDWATASEHNNDHFDVERSFDGIAFDQIAAVAGQGNKTSRTVYSLTDAGVAAKATGPVYYRLKQVDADGTVAYSPVQVVRFTKLDAPVIALYPNPAVGSTQLDLSKLPAGTYQVSLVDMIGRTVLGLDLTAGITHTVDLAPVASGTYVVRVSGKATDGTVVNLAKRLVKE